MKHQYDDKDIQAAIGAACESTTIPNGYQALALRPSQAPYWIEEAAARLHLLKTALANLPESPPPVVHGKTPGQWLHEASRDYDEKKNGCYGWKSWEQTNCQDLYEQAASAVLAAFGNKPVASHKSDDSTALGSSVNSIKATITHFADIRLPESKAPAMTEFKKEMPCGFNSALDVMPDEPTGKSTSEVTITPPWTPEVGDVVMLKSGGPKMTVALVKSNTLGCEWHDQDGTPHARHYFTATLTKADS